MQFLNLLKNRPRTEALPRGSDTQLTFPDPLARFQTTKARAITFGDVLVSRLTENLRQGDPRLLSDIWDLLPFFIDVVATADVATAAAADTSQPSREETASAIPNYQTTPLFLYTSVVYLLSQPQGKEQIYLSTGIKEGDNRRTLDRLCKVALSQQSLTGASADQLDLLKCLRELEIFGLHLHALFHCHPVNGPAMIRPSGPDLETQERYERGGYPCIGGICSRDGWFRFFAHHPFTITVFGKGVVQHEEHLFHIQNYPGCLSHKAVEGEEGESTHHDGARGSAWV
jgi:hypothetical protein